MIYLKEIKSQKLEFRKDSVQTMNDFQRLLGTIQWLRPDLNFFT